MGFGRDDYEFDARDLKRGIEVESREHPQLSREAVKQLVKDHLMEDPDYYRRRKNAAPGLLEKWGPGERRRLKEGWRRRRRREEEGRIDRGYVRQLRRLEREARRNPNAAEKHYETFHGVEPEYIHTGQVWVPGGLVLLGKGIDIGYVIIEKKSKKDHGIVYVHDHAKNVKVYRRARSGEKADLTYHTFPTNLMVLGRFPGLTYEDADGGQHEVRGSGKLCVTPDKKRLVVVGSEGVKFLVKGGELYVKDWIHN